MMAKFLELKKKTQLTVIVYCVSGGAVTEPHWTPIERCGFKPWPGHYVVFLGTTYYFHVASLHPGVEMGIGEFTAGGNPAMDWHPLQGVVEILLVTPCHRNQDKLRWTTRLMCRLNPTTVIVFSV